MTRDLAQLESDLAELRTSTGNNIARINTSISVISVASAISDIRQGINSAELEKLRKTFEDFRADQEKKWKPITDGVTGLALSLTGVMGAITLIKIDIALFKIDEHGITILGATREWPWKKWTEEKFLTKAQKEAQKEDQKNIELVAKNRTYIENLQKTQETVNEIKRRLIAASAASTKERSRLEADPKKKTDRGIDDAKPIVRGVASDVTVLRAALNELTKAF